ncbi:FERM, RhoGEF and pleckstrin domain-containing protein 2 isoform X4 [Sus scrofa]|uniref:FERM, RhoGEF and pleckstrin domain-containing protein 2 isoform X4 n=2 Tax=Sus scrofa TaxID=9823 RepID=UPI000A2B74BF|nr:FERM, RhoGEF and pleckstrin domain-containing protein 2 isoform X4 [Sus scrofa]
MGELEGTYRVLQTPGARLGGQAPVGVSTLEPGQSPAAAAARLQVRVELLDGTVEAFAVEPKCTGQTLLTQVWKRLNLIECDYFGLEFQTLQSRWVWLEPVKPIVRQVRRPKSAALRLAVKFFPPDPGQLQEEHTRYLFALQLKRDLLEERLTCTDATAALLASHLLQSEIGDYDETLDREHLRAHEYLPGQERALERVLQLHRQHVGQTPAESDFQVLEIARKLEMYGLRFHAAADREGAGISLAVSHMGVLVFQSTTKINTFNWSRVRKLSFKRKRFLIKLHPEVHGPYQDTLEFLFSSRDECKRFWKICVEHHTFFRLCDQPKPRAKAVLFTRGSSFRYSGRTQRQLADLVKAGGAKRVPYERRHSKMRAPLRTPTADAPRPSISFTEGLRTPASPPSSDASPPAPPSLLGFQDGFPREPRAPDARWPAAERSGRAGDASRAQPPRLPALQPCQGPSEESPQPPPSTQESPLGPAEQGSTPLLSPAPRVTRMDHKGAPADEAYFIAEEILATERTYLKDLEVITVVGNPRPEAWLSSRLQQAGPEAPSRAASPAPHVWLPSRGLVRATLAPAFLHWGLDPLKLFRSGNLGGRPGGGQSSAASCLGGWLPGSSGPGHLHRPSPSQVVPPPRAADPQAPSKAPRPLSPGARAASPHHLLYITQPQPLGPQAPPVTRALPQWFRRAVAEEDAMPADLTALLFSSVDPIYAFHRGFLHQVEQRLALWKVSAGAPAGGHRRIGDVLLRNMLQLTALTHHFQRLDEVLAGLDTASRRLRRLDALCRNFELQKVCYLPLNAFLLKPLQRLGHYRRLLGRLCECPDPRDRGDPDRDQDRADCRDALQVITEVTATLQHSLLRLENLQKLMELQRDLVGVENLVSPGREFIREGCLRKLTKKGLQQRMFLLFSDMLLYTSRGASGTSRFRTRGLLPLRGMLLIVLDPPVEELGEWPVPHCFTIFAAQKTIVVAASSRLEKEKWMQDLNTAIEAAKSSGDTAPAPTDSVLCALPHGSSEEVPLEQESEGGCSAQGSLDGQGQRRATTTVHVCWHRSTSVSRADRSAAVENQLSGYLLRKFKNSSGWQRLWVVVANFCLFFYKTHQVGVQPGARGWGPGLPACLCPPALQSACPAAFLQDDYPLASLPLLGYRVSVPREADGVHKEHVFKLQFKSHVYFFRAESRYTFRRWMEVIERASSSAGRAGAAEGAA